MSVTRGEGLGDMNPQQLWKTTTVPTLRRLLRVQIVLSRQGPRPDLPGGFDLFQCSDAFHSCAALARVNPELARHHLPEQNECLNPAPQFLY